MATPAYAHGLRYFDPEPSVDDRQRGFAPLPAWIRALPDLPATAKIILTGLIAECRNGERFCRISNRKLSHSTGEKPSVVKYWVRKLVQLGFIERRQLPDGDGEVWETMVLFDPLGLEDTRLKRYPTPANPLADPGQPVSRPRLMGSHPINTSPKTQREMFETTPLPPEGERREGRPRRRQRKTRRQDIIDSYREWANEQHEE